MAVHASSPLETFVASLTQAWRKLLLYPENHPSRQDAIEQPYQTLRTLLSITGGFEIGIAENELVIGEAGFDSPGAAELARSLYQRNVAIVSFEEGLGPQELMTLLLLARPQTTGIPSAQSEGGVREAETEDLTLQLRRAGVEHIRIETVDYQRAFADQVIVEDAFDAKLARPRTLWSRILRRWLGHREGAEEQEADLARVLEVLRKNLPTDGSSDAMAAIHPELVESVEQLATSICEHLGLAPEASAFSEASADDPPTPPSAENRGQARALLDALPTVVRVATLEAALRSLLASGKQQGLDVLQSVTEPPDLIAALRRIRNAGIDFEGLEIARVERLALGPRGRGSAESERDENEQLENLIEILVSDTDRMPPVLVDHFAERLRRIGDTAEGASERPESLDLGSLAPLEALRRLVSDLIEILDTERTGTQLGADASAALLLCIEATTRDLVSRHAPEAAISVIERLRELSAAAAERLDPTTVRAVEASLDLLAGEETVEVFLEALGGALSGDLEPLRTLAMTLGPSFVDRLVGALGDVDQRSTRRQLLSFLESLGAPLVAPHATKRLGDDRWFVVRNMIALLNQVDDRSAVPAVRPLLGHHDSRVCIEALRFLGRFDPGLPTDALAPLLDGHDPSLLERSLPLFGRFRVRAAVDPLIEIANAFDPLNRRRAHRLQAIESLGSIGDPGALERLDSYFATGVSRHSVEERRVAYRSLAGYPAAARSHLVERGLRVRDAEIASICAQLAEGAQPPSSASSADEQLGPDRWTGQADDDD